MSKPTRNFAFFAVLTALFATLAWNSEQSYSQLEFHDPGDRDECARESDRLKAMVYRSFRLLGDSPRAGYYVARHVRQAMARRQARGQQFFSDRCRERMNARLDRMSEKLRVDYRLEERVALRRFVQEAASATGRNFQAMCSEELRQAREWFHRGFECYRNPRTSYFYFLQRLRAREEYLNVPETVRFRFRLSEVGSERAEQVSSRTEALDRAVIRPQCAIYVESVVATWVVNPGREFGMRGTDDAGEACPQPSPGYTYSPSEGLRRMSTVDFLESLGLEHDVFGQTDESEESEEH